MPTFEEAQKMAQAKQAAGPGLPEQEMQSKVQLNQAKTQESQTVAALNTKKAEDTDVEALADETLDEPAEPTDFAC